MGLKEKAKEREKDSKDHATTAGIMDTQPKHASMEKENGKPPGLGKAKGKGFQGNCHNCGAWGHSARYCPKGKGSKGKWKSKKQGFNSVNDAETRCGDCAQGQEQQDASQDMSFGGVIDWWREGQSETRLVVAMWHKQVP